MIPVRQKTLKKLMALHDYVNKKKGQDLSVDIVMKVLNISRRTAYDYLIAYQYVMQAGRVLHGSIIIE